METQVQIMKVFRFMLLPFCKVRYSAGYFITFSRETSSSITIENTGNIV